MGAAVSLVGLTKKVLSMTSVAQPWSKHTIVIESPRLLQPTTVEHQIVFSTQ